MTAAAACTPTVANVNSSIERVNVFKHHIMGDRTSFTIAQVIPGHFRKLPFYRLLECCKFFLDQFFNAAAKIIPAFEKGQ